MKACLATPGQLCAHSKGGLVSCSLRLTPSVQLLTEVFCLFAWLVGFFLVFYKGFLFYNKAS